MFHQKKSKIARKFVPDKLDNRRYENEDGGLGVDEIEEEE